MNNNYICVFDFETGGINVKRGPDNKEAEPLQIGALILDPRRLTIVDEYESLMAPLRPDLVNPVALEVNHLTLDQVKAARHPRIVWKEFVRWVKQYQKKASPWDYPIAAGYNIRTFDSHIVQNLCVDYGPASDNKDTGEKEQDVFHRLYSIDLMDYVWLLMENSNCLTPFTEKQTKHDIKLTTIAKWMGIAFNDAHTALGDVRVTAAIIARLLRLNRSLLGDGIDSGRTKFHNAFGGQTAKEYLTP